MPKSKKMLRREDGSASRGTRDYEVDDETTSEALLQSMTERGRKTEEQDAAKDDPFTDEDGDLHVVPTYSDLSILMDDASLETLPSKEILLRNLKVTLRAIEMAEIAYHALPKQGTATALTQMQNMAKELIAGIEERQDPEVLQLAIMETVVKPMVLEFIKVLTSEAERKRAALMAIIPPESAGVVAHEMKDLLKGVTQGCDEAFDDCVRRLEELLGAKNKGTAGVARSRKK